MYRYDKADRELVVEDWETGEPVRFTFEVGETPVSKAEKLYKKAKKAKRGASHVAPLLEDAQARAAYLEEVAASLELLSGMHEAADLQALRQIQVCSAWKAQQQRI